MQRLLRVVAVVSLKTGEVAPPPPPTAIQNPRLAVLRLEVELVRGLLGDAACEYSMRTRKW
jgi:hypothetical protein